MMVVGTGDAQQRLCDNIDEHTGEYSATAASRGGVLWDPSTQQRLVGAELNRRSILR